MFDPRQIDTKLLIEEVPYLSMIEMQDYDWDNLGEMLNLHVQGAGPRAALKRDEWADSHLHVRPKDYWSSVKAEVFTLLRTTQSIQTYATACRSTLTRPRCTFFLPSQCGYLTVSVPHSRCLGRG